MTHKHEDRDIGSAPVFFARLFAGGELELFR